MKDRELRASRLVKVSRDKVFRAHEDPDLLTQWWGPDGFTSDFHEFDFRTGGRWRFTFHGPDGRTYENDSTFTEIEKPVRVVVHHLSVPVFDLFIFLTERDGGTLVEWIQRFDSAETCAAVRSVCEPANEQNFDRLEAVLAKM